MEKIDDGEPWKSTGTVEVFVFRPTMDQFKNFAECIRLVEEQCAHKKCGIAKIIPPAEWHPRPSRKGNYDDVDSLPIHSPVKERFHGQSGCYTKYNTVYKKAMPVKEYRQLADSAKYQPPSQVESLQDLERYYWRNLIFHEPIYGADTPGSIYDEGVQEWNINHLGTILDLLETECNVEIKGVNTAYLYFGMWKTTFPWHVEDMDLYSINYLHYGAPKFWYGIPSSASERFEGLAKQFFSYSASECKAFLRHKMHLISPSLLRTHNIPYGTMVQRAGEFMITFPKGYHAGFNTGYNCAESTNFAMDRWIDYGKKAVLCTCRHDTVRIDMTPFMRKYRPNEFDKWYDYWYGEREPLPTRSGRSKRHPVSSDSKGSESPCSKRRKLTKRRRTTNETESDQKTSANGDMKHLAASTGAMGDWAKPLEKLWIWRFADFSAEKEFNRKQGLEQPHCAVCQYFVPLSLCKTLETIPQKSKRLVNVLCFSKDPVKTEISTDVEEEETLLTCTDCQVTVHASCYGKGQAPRSSESDWVCARCQDPAKLFVECRLCFLRGGPLVPVEQYGYVHVICALFDRKAVFVNPKSKSAVKITFDDKSENAEEQFECIYCKNDTGSLVTCSSCVPSNAKVFHATCGRLAGVSYEFRDWPVLVAVVCPDHKSGPMDSYFEDSSFGHSLRNSSLKDGNFLDEEHDLPPVKVGARVIAWLDEGTRVRPGTVLKKRREKFCVVDFDDGSVSNDCYLDDISYCECQESGCNGDHVSGAKIRISWPDGVSYGGVFRRMSNTVIYTVKVEGDEKPVEVFRDEIYGPNEMIPDTVLERLNEKDDVTPAQDTKET